MLNDQSQHRTSSSLHASDLMPKDEKSKKILQERSKYLARIINKEDYKELTSYICIQLGEKEFYGIPYHAAKEVKPNISLTKIPHVEDYIAGVINWRGNLITILDLKRFFHLPISVHEKNTFIIIVEARGMTVGILVDEVIGSDQFELAKLIPPWVYGTSIKPEYIQGLHNGKIAIVNIETILSDVRAHLSMKEK